MSKKRKRKSTYRRRYQKPLYRGKFYKVIDSNGGHFSRLFRKNTKKNKYWIVKFTSSNGRHRIQLLHQIDPNKEGVLKSYALTKPLIVTYEMFLTVNPIDKFRVHKEDKRAIKDIQKKKPHK